MSAQELPNLVIGVAVVGYVIYRQLRTRQVNEGRFYLLPLVLCGVGIAQGHLIDQEHRSVSEALLAAGFAAAVLLGAYRAWTMTIWRDTAGVLWRKGTPQTAVAWVLSFAARIGLAVVGAQAGVKSASGSILVFVGLTLLAQSAVVAWRANTLPAARTDTFNR